MRPRKPLLLKQLVEISFAVHTCKVKSKLIRILGMRLVDKDSKTMTQVVKGWGLSITSGSVLYWSIDGRKVRVKNFRLLHHFL